jgi:hypothetical protein
MAQYNVTAPDGSKYQITAPDDATNDQVQAYVQANYQHPAVASGQGLTHTPVAGLSTPAANDPGAPTVQTGSSVQNGIPTASYSPAANTDAPIPGTPAASAQRLPGILGDINDIGNNLGDAFVHNLAKPVIGIGQDAAHWVGGLSSAGAQNAAPGSAGSNINAYVQGKVGDIDKAIAGNEKSYQAAVPNNAASYTGAALGQVLPFLTGAGEANAAAEAPAVASKLGVGGNILKGALTGSLVGASQPVTSPIGAGQPTLSNLVTGGKQAPTFAQQKLEQTGLGAATGGVLAGAGQIASGVGNLARYITNPQSIAGDNISRLVGSDPATLAKLDAASSDVPGVMPTTAQVAPSPSAVGAEKALGNVPGMKEQLAQRQADNNTARLNVLQNMAGIDASGTNDATLQAARDVRTAATKPFVDANLQPGQNPIDPTPIMNSLTALQNGTLRPIVKNGAGDLISSLKGAMNPDGTVDAGLLDDLRRNANDYLVAHSPNGVVPSEAQATLGPVKKQITQLLADNVPGHADYLANYAKLSQPISDMQAASSALAPSDAGSLNTVGQQNLTLAQVSRALKNDDNADYGLSPTARSKLEGIQNSLQQESISNSMRSPGSDTSYNINAQGALAKNLLGPNLGGPTTAGRAGAATVGALIGEHFGGPGGAAAGAAAGAFVNKAANVVNQRIMNRYANGLLNPADAATLIRTYLKGNSGQASKLLAQYPQWNALLSGGAAQQLQKANP